MSVDFKKTLNTKVKKDFDDCVVNTFNQIVEMIQSEIQEGNRKISIPLVVGYNPFTEYCDISTGLALEDSFDFWEKNQGTGKSAKAFGKQIEGYDLYYRDAILAPWHFSFRGFLGLSKTGKLFAEELQKLAEQENMILKGFKPSKAINIPTLIEFKCQYTAKTKDSMPKKHVTPSMRQSLEKADKLVQDFLGTLSLGEKNINRWDTGIVYDFSILRGERSFKAQIALDCDAKEMTLTKIIFVGKYHIEKTEEILELCENYNSGADDSDFELHCYNDKSLRFTNRIGIKCNRESYEGSLNKSLASLNKLMDDRIFKVSCNYAE